ncbi:hypothetical protein GCM10010436_71770 [Paractinoplanes durhamensis]
MSEATLLDDAEQAVALAGRDAPAVQALGRHRQQLAQHQLGDLDVAEAGPEHAGVDAVPGAGVEILLGRAEAHLRPERPLGLGERADQAVVEARVGQRVEHRRAGRQHPIFHPQVRAAAHHRVDRAVPAVDRAVVQPQLAELGHLAALEDLGRVGVVADRQQRREVADVLLEQVEHAGDPALAEPHPGADALRPYLLRAGVGGLLEQRDPGLAPQLPAEQQR